MEKWYIYIYMQEGREREREGSDAVYNETSDMV